MIYHAVGIMSLIIIRRTRILVLCFRDTKSWCNNIQGILGSEGLQWSFLSLKLERILSCSEITLMKQSVFIRKPSKSTPVMQSFSFSNSTQIHDDLSNDT